MSNSQTINELRIMIASPEEITDKWSYGEVKKPETINYRSLRPERDGLFCERIFGTTKDWECYCGKFKSKRFQGMKCDRCGVEVTEKKVRRERGGHITLATPVAHIWFYKAQKAPICRLLEIKRSELEAVLHFEAYIVTDGGELEREGVKVRQSDKVRQSEKEKTERIRRGMVISEDAYENLVAEYGSDSFSADMGAEPIRKLLENLDLKALRDKYKKILEKKKTNKTSGDGKDAAARVIECCTWFLESGNKPEWMILTVLPVIPPDLRPMVQLDGGRFATTDINELYRRVINRNTRLQRLISMQAPEIIIRNEKRLLQQAVDQLLDNGRVKKNEIAKGQNGRELKSLAEQLVGKEGRIRQNLLGKRVDYSGRSVIVAGPELKMYQCGVPGEMAMELFKPFLIRRLHDDGVAANVKKAKIMVEEGAKEAWDVLEEVVSEHPVMLNRAPTLHRLGFQAFEAVLVDGRALKLHPLVCKAFNADFDGDQMAIHLPLSEAAQMECWTLMLSTKDLLDPANGEPIAYPSQDMVLGIYYLTKEKTDSDRKKDGVDKRKHFETLDEIEEALDYGTLSYNEKIYYRLRKGLEVIDENRNSVIADGKSWIETTPGRIIFNSSIPRDVPFQNFCLGDKQLKRLVKETLKTRKPSVEVELLDSLKDLGYKYATLFGATIGLQDMIVPKNKKEIVQKAEEEEAKIKEQLSQGIITEDEKKSRVTSLWDSTKNVLSDELMKDMKEDQNGFNPLYMMADSGARGSSKQISQLGAMRGIMAKANGEMIELPVKSNFKEGLSIIEYFLSSNGARKGLTDTALKTARAGYLTRRMVDAAQDVVITMEDCGTINGVLTRADSHSTLSEKIAGEFPAVDVVHPFLKDEKDKNVVLVKANELITDEKAALIEDSGVESVLLRSVLTCEAEFGVCKKCYGRNYATNKTVEIGEAVGVVAAQSIGQPGTQMNLRSFHEGGIFRVTSNELSFPKDVIITEENRKEGKGEYVKNKDGKNIITRKSTLKATTVLADITNKYSKLLIKIGDGVGKDTPLYVDLKNKEFKSKWNGKLEKIGGKYLIVSSVISLTLPVGAVLSDSIKENEVLVSGDAIATFDPFNDFVVAVHDGVISEMKDFVLDRSYRIETNKTSGKEEWHILTNAVSRGFDPTIIISPNDKDIEEDDEYTIPGGSVMHITSGSVHSGDIIASTPKEDASKSKDISGGLAVLENLFDVAASTDTHKEDDKPLDNITMAHVSGKVEKVEKKEGKGKTYTEILIRDRLSEIFPEKVKEDPNKFLHVHVVKKPGAVITVRKGDEVEVGEFLFNVPTNSGYRETLLTQGETSILQFLIREIQSVYREQNIEINEKHLSVIIRQLLRSVKIVRAGDTRFIEGQCVDKLEFQRENERVTSLGNTPAIGRPCIVGAKTAPKSFESFISGASSSHTGQILTEAAMAGKSDKLRGLKENVIIGKLIPAGTGFPMYKDLSLPEDEKVLSIYEETKKLPQVKKDEDSDDADTKDLEESTGMTDDVFVDDNKESYPEEDE